MVRGLIFGTLAFGAAVALERQFGNIFSDIKRYDRIRRMSGDPPLYTQGLRLLSGLFSNAKQSARQGGAGVAPHGAVDDKSLLESLREDIQRYATIRAM